MIMTASADSSLDSVLQNKMSSAFMDVQNAPFPSYPFRSPYQAAAPPPFRGQGDIPIGGMTSRGMTSLGYPFPAGMASLAGTGAPDFNPTGLSAYRGFPEGADPTGKVSDGKIKVWSLKTLDFCTSNVI